MRKLILGHLVYLYTPLGILACIWGIFYGGNWAWLGVGIFAFNIAVDSMTAGIHPGGARTDKNGKPLGIPAILNLMMYLQYPLFICLQLVLAWRVYEYVAGVPVGASGEFMGYQYMQGITGWQLVGATIGAGMHQGLGIIFGHELSHTKGFGFMISRLMMALSGCAHFCFAHVYNHHLELGRAWLGPENNKLGDDCDPATSPRGRSIYTHFLISHIGQSYFGIKTEARRLKRQGKSFLSLSNRWIRGYLMSLPTVALFAYAGWLGAGAQGLWLGLLVMFVVWVISNFELEALNYMEHYGLIRVKGEPIEYRHSWDNDNLFTSWAFIEIGRQADHHDRGETHFWELTSVGTAPDGAPNACIGYYHEFSLALMPPLWHAMMKKKLAIWDRDFASPEEREIAREINKKVGYDVEPDDTGKVTLEVNYT